MKPVAIGHKILQPVSATGPTRHAQDTSIQLSFQTECPLPRTHSYPSQGPGYYENPGGKTLFSQEVGAKLKRRVQGLRHSEFDLLQLCVCNCTRSPSGSATSVPPPTKPQGYSRYFHAVGLCYGFPARLRSGVTMPRHLTLLRFVSPRPSVREKACHCARY